MSSKYPKLVSRGALTLAAPVNQLKYGGKRASDLIGINYSPHSRQLSTAKIYASTTLDFFATGNNKNNNET